MGDQVIHVLLCGGPADGQSIVFPHSGGLPTEYLVPREPIGVDVRATAADPVGASREVRLEYAVYGPRFIHRAQASPRILGAIYVYLGVSKR